MVTSVPIVQNFIIGKLVLKKRRWDWVQNRFSEMSSHQVVVRIELQDDLMSRRSIPFPLNWKKIQRQTRNHYHNKISVYFCYAKIKHSDSLKLVIWLATSNQSTLFHCGIFTLCKNYDISSRAQSNNIKYDSVKYAILALEIGWKNLKLQSDYLKLKLEIFIPWKKFCD